MRRMLVGAAVAAALGLCACEGMAPGGYGDIDDPDPNLEATQAAARAAMPQQPMPPRPMSLPNGQAAPGAIPQPVIPKPPTMSTPATGGPSRTTPPPAAPAPPPAPTGGPSKMSPPPVAPAPPTPRAGGCSAPNVAIRKEIAGAMEINCGPPPAPVPAGMSCKAGEQLTYLSRNGASSYQCMK